MLAGLLTISPSHLAWSSESESLNGLVEEYQFKALFLYNFANFVEWPNQAFPTDSSPLKLCLVGYVPFGGFLDTVDQTLIGDRTLHVYRTESAEDEVIKSGCHILFEGIDKEKEMQQFFNNLNHTFVLSVGDEPNFANLWGTVNIFRVRDGAKVEINLKRAMENQLTVSSDLLAIAEVLY